MQYTTNRDIASKGKYNCIDIIQKEGNGLYLVYLLDTIFIKSKALQNNGYIVFAPRHFGRDYTKYEL